MRKAPFSKIVVTYVLMLSSAFLVWACVEMHILGNLEPISYIGTGVVGLIATSLGFYIWRAKESDKFTIEIERINAEKELGVPISLGDNEESEDEL